MDVAEMRVAPIREDLRQENLGYYWYLRLPNGLEFGDRQPDAETALTAMLANYTAIAEAQP